MKVFSLLAASGLLFASATIADALETVTSPAPRATLELSKPSDPKQGVVITGIALQPGGQLIATAGDDHSVRLWKTENAQLVSKLVGHTDWVRSLSFSPDGQTLASASDDHQILMWDVSNGQVLRSLPRQEIAIYSVTFSPDGQTIAAAGFEKNLYLYDVATGTRKAVLEGPCDDLRRVVFSPNGELLATGGRLGQVQVWSMHDQQPLWKITASQQRVRAVAFSPDGKQLATAGDSGEIKTWDAATGQEQMSLGSQGTKIFSLTYCGGNHLAAGGANNSIRVLNVGQKSLVQELLGHTGSVATLVYDQQSGTLISAGFDTTLRVWQMPSELGTGGLAEAQDSQSAVR